MIIGALTLDLDLPDACSLKDKRAVLNRVRDRIRRKFNVAVAEVEENEVWNRAVVAVVAVSNQQRFCNQVLSKVAEFTQTLPDCIVEDFSMEFI